MKKVALLLLLTVIIISSNQAQNTDHRIAEKPAKVQLKKDEDEMKTYVMVFLVTGKNRNQPKEEAEKIQELHLKHLSLMHEEGLLLMAGPFVDKSNIKGILVMNSEDIEKMKEHVEKDPAIIAGRLEAEYHLWYTKSGKIELP